MKDDLEDFIDENAPRFAKGSPSPKVWESLEQRLVAYHKEKHEKGRIRRFSLLAAACLAACVVVGVFLHRSPGPDVAVRPGVQTPPAPVLSPATPPPAISQRPADSAPGPLSSPSGLSLPTAYTRTLSRYSLRIREKQKQLYQLRKDDPELYASFQKASDALTGLYNRLKEKLPNSPNRDKVLAEMIDNLAIQEQALDNQLRLVMELHSTGKDTIKIPTDAL